MCVNRNLCAAPVVVRHMQGQRSGKFVRNEHRNIHGHEGAAVQQDGVLKVQMGNWIVTAFAREKACHKEEQSHEFSTRTSLQHDVISRTARLLLPLDSS